MGAPSPFNRRPSSHLVPVDLKYDILIIFVYLFGMGRGRVHAMMYVCVEVRRQLLGGGGLVLSFTVWIPRFKLRSSGLSHLAPRFLTTKSHYNKIVEI